MYIESAKFQQRAYFFTDQSEHAADRIFVIAGYFLPRPMVCINKVEEECDGNLES